MGYWAAPLESSTKADMRDGCYRDEYIMAEVVGGVRGAFNMKGRSYVREDATLVSWSPPNLKGLWHLATTIRTRVTHLHIEMMSCQPNCYGIITLYPAVGRGVCLALTLTLIRARLWMEHMAGCVMHGARHSEGYMTFPA
jgi:hypothetical protein